MSGGDGLKERLIDFVEEIQEDEIERNKGPCDKELSQGVKKYGEIQKKIKSLLDSRGETLKKLEDLKKDIEESYDKSRKARIGGTVATISGSLISIVGFGLTPVTFGASLGLAITGGALAVAGGTTIAGAEIGYHMISKSKVKDANEACAEDRKKMEDLKHKGKEFKELLASLAEKFGTSEESIYEKIKELSKDSVSHGMYGTYKLFEGLVDAGRAAKTTASVVRAGQAGARTAWVGLSTAGRVFGIAGVVFDVVFIPVDIAVMMKSAYDVHRYKLRGKSNSKCAKEVKELIDKLERHKQKIEALEEKRPSLETPERQSD